MEDGVGVAEANRACGKATTGRPVIADKVNACKEDGIARYRRKEVVKRDEKIVYIGGREFFSCITAISVCETPVAACSGWADPVAGLYAEHDFRQNH